MFSVGCSGQSAFSITVARDNTIGNFRLDFIPVTVGTSVTGALSTANFDNQYNVHIAVVVSVGDYGRLYVNGVLTTTSNLIPLTWICYGNNKTVNIGDTAASTNGNFVGSVNDLRIYPVALSASDVAAHYAAGLAALPQVSCMDFL